MRTWTKTLGVYLAALTLLAAQTSLALARGGGGKGGSLGGSVGRSFGSSLGSGAGQAFGGYSGGLGGFHFFPFFFWDGGPSVGGGSLFGGLLSATILLLLAAVVLKALRSARDARRNYRRGGFGGWQGSQDPVARREISPDVPVDLGGVPITNNANYRRFAKAIAFTQENMRYFAETFPRWDREYLIGRVRQVFFWLQDAWARQDLSEAADYLAPALAEQYRSELEAMQRRGERNMIKEPLLHQGDIEFVHSHLGEDDEHFVAMVFASLIDYTVDGQGRVVSGDDHHRLYFTEFWEFIWDKDKWVLAKIHQEDAIELARIARGEDQ